MSKSVLFKNIQCSLSMPFSFIWPIDRALSGSSSPGQSGPGSDGNEGVLSILQSSSITGTSSSDCLVSYSWNSLGILTPYINVVSVYYSPYRRGKKRKMGRETTIRIFKTTNWQDCTRKNLEKARKRNLQRDTESLLILGYLKLQTGKIAQEKT